MHARTFRAVQSQGTDLQEVATQMNEAHGRAREESRSLEHVDSAELESL
jgi:hypothetical protein